MTNRLKFFRSTAFKALALVACAAICGGVAGGLAGFYAASSVPAQLSAQSSATGTASGVKLSAATSTPAFSLIPVERPALASILPPAFANRASLVGSLYRGAKPGTFDDRLLGDDRLVGQVVALTSDGWFLTSAAALGNAHLADLTIWSTARRTP